MKTQWSYIIFTFNNYSCLLLLRFLSFFACSFLNPEIPQNRFYSVRRRKFLNSNNPICIKFVKGDKFSCNLFFFLHTCFHRFQFTLSVTACVHFAFFVFVHTLTWRKFRFVSKEKVNHVRTTAFLLSKEASTGGVL